MKQFRVHLPIIVADLLGFLLHLILFTPIVELFARRRPFGGGWFLLAGSYLLFCFGVNGLKKLQPRRPSPSWLTRLARLNQRPWLWPIALLMSVAFILIQADLNQLLESTLWLAENPGQVHEGEVSLYFSFGPTFLWVILALFYLLVLITSIEPRYAPRSWRYAWTVGWGLTLNNLLAVLFSAYLAALVTRLWGTLTIGQMLLMVTCLLPLFGLWFVSPRLWVATRHVPPWPLHLLFGAFLLLCVVRSIV